MTGNSQQTVFQEFDFVRRLRKTVSLPGVDPDLFPLLFGLLQAIKA